MPDPRRHRGAHPLDAALFAAAQLPRLRAATLELSWLLGRGYAPDAAGTLVGDHHQLQRRQRVAIGRAACPREAATARAAATRPLLDQRLALDGFNVLITVEAALSGGVLLRGVDARLRDLASVHGSYRTVEETAGALDHLARALAPAREALWVLDRPVSNSGRLARLLRERGWLAELADQADAALVAHARGGALLCSADGPLLDRVVAAGGQLGDPVRAAVDPHAAWIVDLSPGTTTA